jgi:hypothetical protein
VALDSLLIKTAATFAQSGKTRKENYFVNFARCRFLILPSGMDDVGFPRCEARRSFTDVSLADGAIPEAIREVGIFTKEEEFLVVFPTGGVIEVWPASEWKMHQRALAQDLSQLTDSASEEIDALRS